MKSHIVRGDLFFGDSKKMSLIGWVGAPRKKLHSQAMASNGSKIGAKKSDGAAGGEGS